MTQCGTQENMLWQLPFPIGYGPANVLLSTISIKHNYINSLTDTNYQLMYTSKKNFNFFKQCLKSTKALTTTSIYHIDKTIR